MVHQEYQRGLHVFEDWLERELASLALLSHPEGSVDTLEKTLQQLQVVKLNGSRTDRGPGSLMVCVTCMGATGMYVHPSNSRNNATLGFCLQLALNHTASRDAGSVCSHLDEVLFMYWMNIFIARAKSIYFLKTSPVQNIHLASVMVFAVSRERVVFAFLKKKVRTLSCLYKNSATRRSYLVV